MKHTVTGTLLKTWWRMSKTQNRYGLHLKRASNNPLHFGHFRDAYLADFRQEPTESMADLDIHIKQTVKGCQWKKEHEEE